MTLWDECIKWDILFIKMDDITAHDVMHVSRMQKRASSFSACTLIQHLIMIVYGVHLSEYTHNISKWHPTMKPTCTYVATE